MERGKLPLITKSRLVRDLKKIGVKKGQTVMLHVSVKAIGWIVGGPDMILQALLEILGPTGTLMMYVGWEEAPPDRLEDWPKDLQQAYLNECPPFDPATSRARRNHSVLAEYLRTLPGTFRSNHPEASVAAIGAKACWITENHPLNYPYGSGSPLAKLCKVKGKVLLLGAPLNTTTLLHYAENLAKVPNKRTVHYRAPVHFDEQRVWVEVEDFDTSRGIIANAEEYFLTIMHDYIISGKGHSGKVGAAQSYLFESDDLVRFAKQWLEKTFGGSGPQETT